MVGSDTACECNIETVRDDLIVGLVGRKAKRELATDMGRRTGPTVVEDDRFVGTATSRIASDRISLGVATIRARIVLGVRAIFARTPQFSRWGSR